MKWRTFDGKLGNATQALKRACLSFCHVFLFRGSLHRSPRCYTSATSIFHLTAGVGPSRELWVHFVYLFVTLLHICQSDSMPMCRSAIYDWIEITDTQTEAAHSCNKIFTGIRRNKYFRSVELFRFLFTSIITGPSTEKIINVNILEIILEMNIAYI